MPYEEFQGWCLFFEARPPGWREDNRAYMIMSSQGMIKDPPEKLFSSLAAIKNARIKKDNAMKTLKSSQMFLNMMNAIGGDKLEIFDEGIH